MNYITQPVAPQGDHPYRPDFGNIKVKMKATWEDGDYATFARFMQPGAEVILNNWQIPPGSHLLDIGCGSGQTAIPAARAGLKVTGVDIASNLIEHARERAQIEGLDAEFVVGDAEDLPYWNAEFDVVISLIGAMFAPRPESVAAELARVCRPGGRLHMANWTPEGFSATMFKCVGQYVPPPQGIAPPPLWGVEQIVEERLQDGFRDFRLERTYYPRWRYPFGTAQLVEFFRQHFGPVKKAFDGLDEYGQKSLRAELERIFSEYNIATDGTTELRGEYLDVSAVRR
ncbi:MAG: class I SAM-dependent methyltransferase [Thiotrichales bacterium]|nr:MAG: class I SAM-dependent methyltransferase [Thiotrichales bacterium]